MLNTHIPMWIISNNIKLNRKKRILAFFRQIACFTLAFPKKLKSEQCFKPLFVVGACFGLLFSTSIVYYMWRWLFVQ